jgi:hypothetical protein
MLNVDCRPCMDTKKFKPILPVITRKDADVIGGEYNEV